MLPPTSSKKFPTITHGMHGVIHWDLTERITDKIILHELQGVNHPFIGLGSLHFSPLSPNGRKPVSVVIAAKFYSANYINRDQ